MNVMNFQRSKATQSEAMSEASGLLLYNTGAAKGEETFMIDVKSINLLFEQVNKS